MKRFLTIALVLLSYNAIAQFTASCEFTGFVSSGTREYTGAITEFLAQREGNDPTDIQVGFYIVDGNFNRYRIDFASTTLSGGTLTVYDLDSVAQAPQLKGIIYENLANDLIPYEPDNTAGISQILKAKIETWNIKRIADNLGAGGTPEVIASASDLSGAAPTGAKLGVNTSNGNLFYVDTGGNWVQISGGGGSQNLNSVLTQGNDAGALRIVNLADPVDNQDAATKIWVNSNDDVDDADADASNEIQTIDTFEVTTSGIISLSLLNDNEGVWTIDIGGVNISEFVNDVGYLTAALIGTVDGVGYDFTDDGTNASFAYDFPELSNISSLDVANDRLIAYDDDGTTHGYITPSQIIAAVNEESTTASDGLVEIGGDIRLSFSSLSAATPVGADEIAFADGSDSDNEKKVTFSSIPVSILLNDEGFINSEVDGSTTNEIQTIDVSSLTGTNLNLSLLLDGEATKVIDLSPLKSEFNVDDLWTLMAITEGNTNFGTFTGTTITDNLALKPVLQELEDAIEAVGAGAADGVLDGVVVDGGNEQVDFSVAAPGADVNNVDFSAMLFDAELTGSNGVTVSDTDVQLDLNSLPTEASPDLGDFIPIVNISESNIEEKITLTALQTLIDTDTDTHLASDNLTVSGTSVTRTFDIGDATNTLEFNGGGTFRVISEDLGETFQVQNSGISLSGATTIQTTGAIDITLQNTTGTGKIILLPGNATGSNGQALITDGTGSASWGDVVTSLPSLTDGTFWLGDASNDAQEVSMSLDATMDNTGAVSLATNSVDANELVATAVTAASYGNATSFTNFTVDADGRLTAASTVALPIQGINEQSNGVDLNVSSALLNVNVDVNELTAATPALGDEVWIGDISDSNNPKKATFTQIQTLIDTDNQTIDKLNLNGTTLEVSLEDDGEADQTVDLSSLQDGTGTDDQTLSEVLTSGNSAGATDIDLNGNSLLNTGYIDIQELDSAPSTPPTDYVRIYADENNRLFFRQNGGDDYELTYRMGDIGTITSFADGDFLLGHDISASATSYLGRKKITYANFKIDLEADLNFLSSESQTLGDVMTQGNTASATLDMGDRNIDNANRINFEDNNSSGNDFQLIESVTSGDLELQYAGTAEYNFTIDGTAPDAKDVLTRGVADGLYGGDFDIFSLSTISVPALTDRIAIGDDSDPGDEEFGITYANLIPDYQFVGAVGGNAQLNEGATTINLGPSFHTNKGSDDISLIDAHSDVVLQAQISGFGQAITLGDSKAAIHIPPQYANWDIVAFGVSFTDNGAEDGVDNVLCTLEEVNKFTEATTPVTGAQVTYTANNNNGGAEDNSGIAHNVDAHDNYIVNLANGTNADLLELGMFYVVLRNE